jgi:hypothetical protein
MTGEAVSSQSKSKKQLTIILAIPIVVVTLSSLVFVLVQKQILVLGTVNIGTLIHPPVQWGDLHPTRVDGGEFEFNRADSTWLYAVVGSSTCTGECERMLYLTRQTHTALGKKMGRVARVYIAVDGPVSTELRQFLQAEHSDITVLNIDRNRFVGAMGGLAIDPMDRRSFYVVDPLGWAMMYYQAQDTRLETLTALGKDILKDMRRLLR